VQTLANSLQSRPLFSSDGAAKLRLHTAATDAAVVIMFLTQILVDVSDLLFMLKKTDKNIINNAFRK